MLSSFGSFNCKWIRVIDTPSLFPRLKHVTKSSLVTDIQSVLGDFCSRRPSSRSTVLVCMQDVTIVHSMQTGRLKTRGKVSCLTDSVTLICSEPAANLAFFKQLLQPCMTETALALLFQTFES